MPGTSKVSTTVGVRMPNEIHAEVVRIAQRERRSVSWVMAEAAAEYVKRDVQAAKRRKTP
jgi:predicted transcriptional regulator